MPKPPLPSDLDAFLTRPNHAVIGTLRPDGAPHTVATWYLWQDGRVLVNMDEGRKRLDFLRNDPRVALTVLDPDNWYAHVSLRGRVVSLADDADLVDIDRVAQHYLGKPYPTRDRGRVSAWIEVDSWHAWRS
jgi:PPOX class probable F420-dependent enzyme